MNLSVVVVVVVGGNEKGVLCMHCCGIKIQKCSVFNCAEGIYFFSARVSLNTKQYLYIILHNMTIKIVQSKTNKNGQICGVGFSH
jgi:hypothetical protein